MKTLLLSVLAILISVHCYAQKPKKTFDSEKFVKKVQFSMVPDLIGKWLPDDAALQHIADKSGKKLGELREEKKTNSENIKKNVDGFMSKGLAYIIDKTEVKVKQETPVKIADIVLYCHTKGNKFTMTLSNCVQTNISWYLGDAITAEGDGFENAVSAKEDKKPSKFVAMLISAGEIQESVESANKNFYTHADSLRKARPGYETKNSIYYNHKLSDLPLNGYYINNNGVKVDAVIAYLKPQFLMGLSNSLFICKQVTGKKVDYLNTQLESNFKEWVKYEDIKAFFVADQLYVKTSDGTFTTLISEGAIHTTTSAKLYNKETQLFKVYPVTQKLNGRKYGTYLDKITEAELLGLMADAPEIVQGFENGEYTLNEAEIRYNIWYEENNPGEINYIFGKDYEVTKITSTAVASPEAIAYEKEIIDIYDQAHTVPKQDLFAGRPLDPNVTIVSSKPEVRVKKETFINRLNRIKTDGNKVGVLVRCKNTYVNPDNVAEGITKVKVVGSYGPLEGSDKVAENIVEELSKGFGVNVFETVDYSLIPVKDGMNGKMDDWWSTKYKVIIIYDIIPSYTAVKYSNSSGEREFKAQMKVNTEVIVMSAEDKQQKRLKYVTSSPSKWGYFKTVPFKGSGATDFDIIQDLKEVINPPSDVVVIEALIKSQKESLDKFIKKRSK